jgi:hypothetical protein
MKIPKPFTPEAKAWNREIDEIGHALADAAIERGDRLTERERFAVNHCIRWGSDGYAAFVVKLGSRWWRIDHESARTTPLFKTKAAATRQFEIFLRKWERMLHHERVLDSGTARMS